jgi:hypothetical protein
MRTKQKKSLELKRLYSRNWAKRNREKDPELYNSKMRVYKASHPQTERQKAMAIGRAMKSNYGITIEQYYAMLREQNGLCKLCSKPPKSRRLVIDHCHQTGKVRGLLCNGCNRSMHLLDNADLLAKAIKYKEGTL